MTAPLDGHPFGDMRAILANGWAVNGRPMTLDHIFQAEFTSVGYAFALDALSSADASLYRSEVAFAFAQIESFTQLTFFEGQSAASIGFTYEALDGLAGEASW